MRIKHSLFLVLFIISVFISKAQNRFCIFAGPQATTVKYTVNDAKQPTGHKYGFHAGFGWKIPFENHLYFSTSGFYSLKGYKVRFNQFAFPPDTAAIDNATSIHTFELAFLLQFDIGDQPGHFFIKAGPSLDFQLAGKEKFHLKNGSLVDRSMPYGFAEYGHYSASLLMQFGFETKGNLMVFGQYNLGLGSINNADNGPVIKHRTFALTIGTWLNRKKSASGTGN